MAEFEDFGDRLGPVAAQTGLALLAEPAEGEEQTAFQRFAGALAGIFAEPTPAAAAVPATTGTTPAPVAGPAAPGTVILPVGLLVAGGIGLIFLLR